MISYIKQLIALFISFSTVTETTKTLLMIEQQAQIAGFYQH
ncbi:hypothetical protein [Acinetobacter defluvii]